MIHQRVGQGESRRTAERAMPFVHVLIDQHGKTLDNVPMSGAVFGRAPADEIRVDEVRRDQLAIAASANFIDGLTAILGIPRIPSPRLAAAALAMTENARYWVRLAASSTRCSSGLRRSI